MAEETDNNAFRVHCLVQMGELLQSVGRLQDSENKLRDALTLCFSHLREASLETARCYAGGHFNLQSSISMCLQGIGMSCMKLRKIPPAIESYEKAVSLYKAVNGERSIEVADCCLALGKALASGKKHEAAYKQCMEALEIRREVYGHDHVLVARALADVGAQLKLMKKEREAEQIYRHCA